MKTAHNFKNDHLCPRCASAVSDVHCLEYGMVFISRDSLHCIITILESHPTRRKYGFTIRGSWIRIRCIVGACTGCSYGVIKATELEWTSDKLLDNQHSTFFFLKYLSILKRCTFSSRHCTTGCEKLKRNNAWLKSDIHASPKGAQFAILIHALHKHYKHVMFHRDLIDRLERLQGPRFVNQNARQQ